MTNSINRRRALQTLGAAAVGAVLHQGVTSQAQAAKADPKIARFLEGKTIRREIYVPGRLVNLVAT